MIRTRFSMMSSRVIGSGAPTVYQPQPVPAEHLIAAAGRCQRSFYIHCRSHPVFAGVCGRVVVRLIQKAVNMTVKAERVKFLAAGARKEA